MFALAGWFYVTNNSMYLMATTNGAATDTGFQLTQSATGPGLMAWDVNNGASSQRIWSTKVFPTNGWHFVGMSCDEGAASMIWQVDAAQETVNGTYTSPSAGAVSYALSLGAGGAGGGPVPAGSRISMLAMWEGVALTQADLLAIYNATKARFGL